MYNHKSSLHVWLQDYRPCLQISVAHGPWPMGGLSAANGVPCLRPKLTLNFDPDLWPWPWPWPRPLTLTLMLTFDLDLELWPLHWPLTLTLTLTPTFDLELNLWLWLWPWPWPWSWPWPLMLTWSKVTKVPNIKICRRMDRQTDGRYQVHYLPR